MRINQVDDTVAGIIVGHARETLAHVQTRDAATVTEITLAHHVRELLAVVDALQETHARDLVLGYSDELTRGHAPHAPHASRRDSHSCSTCPAAPARIPARGHSG